MIIPPKVSIIEGSVCRVSVEFLDMNGNPFVPVSSQYRVDDIATGSQIIGWTPLDVVGTTQLITITATQNALLSAPGTRHSEDRQVVVQTTDSDGNVDMKSITYSVMRLVGLG